MIGLVDGDILVYRIGFACETKFYDIHTEKGVVSFDSAKAKNAWLKEKSDEFIKNMEVTTRIKPEPLENALHSIIVQLKTIKKNIKAKNLKIFLTGKDNFRLDIADYYKANRKDAPKPYHYEAIRDYLVKYHGAEIIDGQEADDAMGIAQCDNYLKVVATKPYEFESVDKYKSTCICTIDKDLDMIPGRHYDLVKFDKYTVDEVQAMRFFYYQMLQGDTADNIPGYGKITGERVRKWDDMLAPIDDMSNELDMWYYVRGVYTQTFMQMHGKKDSSMFTKVGKAVDAKLTEIGQLLWIRREPDQVWRPPVG